jgi:hypothetical protein
MTEVAHAAGIVLYSQWLSDKENIMSDCMSLDHNLPNSDLIHMLHLFIPDHISEDFIINQFPSNIVSFLLCLMQITQETTLSTKVPPRVPGDLGDVGLSSVKKSELHTPYLSSLKSRNGTDSLAPFAKPYGRDSSQQNVYHSSNLGHAMSSWTT